MTTYDLIEEQAKEEFENEVYTELSKTNLFELLTKEGQDKLINEIVETFFEVDKWEPDLPSEQCQETGEYEYIYESGFDWKIQQWFDNEMVTDIILEWL